MLLSSQEILRGIINGVKKRVYNISLLENAISYLIETGILPLRFKAHKLTGNYNNCWECHLKPDWLLIWQMDENEKIIKLIGTGTHSDLF